MIRRLWGTCKQTAQWLWRMTLPYLPRILLLLALDVLLVALGVGVPLVNKRLIDSATSPGAMLDVRGFALLAGMTALSTCFGTLTVWLSSLLHTRLAFGVRSQVYSRVMKGRWLQVSRYHTGDLTARLCGDADAVATGVAELAPNLVVMLLKLAASFFVLYAFDPLLALSAVGLGLVGQAVSLLYGGKLHRYQKDLKENEASYQAFLQESTANITVLKAFEQADACQERLDALGDTRLKTLQGRARVQTWMRLGTGGIFSAGYLFAFGLGLYRLCAGDITYGTLSVFLALVSQVQAQIMTLPQLVPKGVSALASAGRVMELDALEAEEAKQSPPLAGPIGIRLEEIFFAYGDKPVFDHASAAIAPKEHIAVIGESGAGKTTLARLLLGLIEPGKGGVFLYDAAGERAQAGAGTRSYFSYVSQGNTLLSGSIRENLRMGDPHTSDAHMLDALDTAEASFVRHLPLGLDTILTEQGGTLSEGQAQRVAIARALLRKRPILILDEVTSALDLDTEERIVRNLRSAAADTTCIVISHRPSLLCLCERCLRVADGTLLSGENQKIQAWESPDCALP